MRVIRLTRRPKPWSVGIAVAAVILYIYWEITEEISWWILVIAIVFSFLVDAIVSGDTHQEDITIDKE